MTKYIYSIRKDKENKKYNTEEELKEANPDVCEPKEHDWSTTFVFGVYNCRKCEARRK